MSHGGHHRLTGVRVFTHKYLWRCNPKMSNAKRFISVILAIVMICSTLVVGASAAYTEYKNSAIANQYNGLDKPVLTTQQYASAAMDELDRMLNVEQIHLTSDDLFGIGELDVTSVDATMDSVYALVNSGVFKSFGGLLGDLSTLSANSFKPESDGGIRRTTAGKTDVDVIYQVLGFLYENKDIFVSYANQTINLGTILPSVVDLSDYTDLNKLLKSLLYDAVYDADAPEDIASYSIDTMAQTLIDQVVVKEVPELEGKTSVSTGTMYDFIDIALKTLYNTLLVDLLNGNVKYELNKFCGVTEMVTDEDYNILNDDTKDKSAMNEYAQILNVDYTIAQYDFTDATLVSQFNNVVGSLLNTMLSSTYRAKFTWTMGSNDNLLNNLVNVAKAVVTDDMLAEALFQPYNTRYTDAEINAMSPERLITYLLTILINNSADELWVPESTATLREFGFICLEQLLATAAPELDFSSMDRNSTDTLVIMGIDFAIYNINAVLDMNLEYVYTMAGVDAQLAKAAKYGVDNYGGLLNGMTFNNKNDGWRTFDDILFSILDKTWLPEECYTATYCFKTLLIDTLIDGILDLDVAGMLGKLENNHPGGLNDTPKEVILGLAIRIINIIFPNAINANAKTFDAIATNSALAGTIDAIFSDLYNCRANLVAGILPTLCDILDLTNEQEFEFPEYTYEETLYEKTGAIDTFITMRNESTGINTGFTYYDNGVKKFQQDQLYTYEIKSITCTPATATAFTGSSVKFSTVNVPGYDWTSSANPTLAGGQTGYIHLTGTCATLAGTSVRIAVTYDVLTEDGTPLTDAPITDYIYTLVTKTASDEETLTEITSTNYDVNIPSYNYCASVRDITRIEATVVNRTTADATVDVTAVTTDTTNYATLQKLLNTGYIELTTNNVAKAGYLDSDGDLHATKTSFNIFKTTEAYDLLPDVAPEDDPEAKTKADAWAEIQAAGEIKASTGKLTSYCKFANLNLAYMIGGTNINSGSKKTSVFCYNNFNLAGILSSELNKHRQAANYSDATAWDNYMTAMNNAAAAVYAPYQNGTFAGIATTSKYLKMQNAAPALVTAIEALDECEEGGGFDGILAIIDSVNPDNVDENGDKLSYDDPAYKFFGVADYEAYTYYNYKDEYKAATRAYESTLVPDEDGNYKTVSALKVAELEHRLGLYAGRLIEKDVIKTHLQKQFNAAQALTSENEAKYTAESWANYVKAYNFANTVLGTAAESLNQTKVNKAYEILIENEKCLVLDSGDQPGGDTPTFTPIDPDTDVALTVVETADEGLLLCGIQPGVDGTTLFETTGCTVEVEMAGAKIATGDTINIKDNGGNIIATYTVCITGDVDCDGAAGSAYDLIVYINVVNNLLSPSALIATAGDLEGSDGDMDAYDLISVINVVNNMSIIDFNNRTLA